MPAMEEITDSPVKTTKPFKKRPIVPDPTEEHGSQRQEGDVDEASEMAHVSSPPAQVLVSLQMSYKSLIYS